MNDLIVENNNKSNLCDVPKFKLLIENCNTTLTHHNLIDIIAKNQPSLLPLFFDQIDSNYNNLKYLLNFGKEYYDFTDSSFEFIFNHVKNKKYEFNFWSKSEIKNILIYHIVNNNNKIIELIIHNCIPGFHHNLFSHKDDKGRNIFF